MDRSASHDDAEIASLDLTLTAMTPHAAAHIVSRPVVKCVGVDTHTACLELAVVVAIRTSATFGDQATAEKLQGAVGLNNYVGQVISAWIMCVEGATFPG